MRRTILLFLLSMAVLAAQSQDPFEDARNLLRNGGSRDQILTALGDYKTGSHLSRAEYYRLTALAYLADGDEDRAKENLQISMEAAERAREREETSRAYFFLSSSGFLLAGLEGVGAIISQSDRLNDYTNRAYEMDPEDPEIIFQKASSLAYPPKLFGGNPKKAAEMLERGLALDGLDDYQRFDLLSTLSYCYEKIGKSKKALDIARRGLMIYPNNGDLLERTKKLEQRVK